MIEKTPHKINRQHSKQLQNNNTMQFAKIIGNQAILQFGQLHHVIPKALFQQYAHVLNGFDEDTTVDLDDHSGSHPTYSLAVAKALDHCVQHGIDCGLFASSLTTHLTGLNSIKNIDFEYLLTNVILPMSAPTSYQSSSGTQHTPTKWFDPSPPLPPPKSSFGRILKQTDFYDPK